MGFIKALGVAWLTALVATVALVTATTASADSFCLESGHHTNECPMNQRYAGNIKGVTTGAPALILENGEIEVECSSEILGAGNTIVNEGAHTGVKILIAVGGLTFSNCTGLCEAAENVRPFWLLFQSLPLDVFTSSDNQGRPRVAIFECLFGIECEFQFTNEGQLLSLAGDTITANAVPIEKVAGPVFCPNANLSFDVTYLLTKDEANGAPVYLAALP